MHLGKGIWNRVRYWTLQELVAVVCPFSLDVAPILLLTMYCFRQDMSTLIYSSLPEEYKTQFWFAACFLQEVNQMWFSLHSISLVFQLHLLLPGTLSRVLKALAHSAKTCYGTSVAFDRIIRQIQVVQLVLNLFNVGHRNITYIIKLACIMVAVVNGYGAITHGAEDIVFLLFTSCMTCNFVFFYAFVYEKAFAIPDGLERVKRALTAEIQAMRHTPLKKIRRKQVEAVPLVGIKVGDFHMLERESIPIFVHFVLENIVNLLVSHL